MTTNPTLLLNPSIEFLISIIYIVPDSTVSALSLFIGSISLESLLAELSQILTDSFYLIKRTVLLLFLCKFWSYDVRHAQFWNFYIFVKKFVICHYELFVFISSMFALKMSLSDTTVAISAFFSLPFWGMNDTGWNTFWWVLTNSYAYVDHTFINIQKFASLQRVYQYCSQVNF